MSLIEEGFPKQIRMAYLAIIGAVSIFRNICRLANYLEYYRLSQGQRRCRTPLRALEGYHLQGLRRVLWNQQVRKCYQRR